MVKDRGRESVPAQDCVFLFPDARSDHTDLAHLQQIAGFPLKGQTKEEHCSQNRCFVAHEHMLTHSASLSHIHTCAQIPTPIQSLNCYHWFYYYKTLE